MTLVLVPSFKELTIELAAKTYSNKSEMLISKSKSDLSTKRCSDTMNTNLKGLPLPRLIKVTRFTKRKSISRSLS